MADEAPPSTVLANFRPSLSAAATRPGRALKGGSRFLVRSPSGGHVGISMKDPFVEFKEAQREGWKHYGPAEAHTVRPAAHLVRVAGITAGQRVLDVACGTGPVAVTAARAGATVAGLDLTPELLVRARENAEIAAVDIAWREGDAEALPYRNEEFDVVLSQFGHIFAPRPDVVTSEMLRVLKPGGTLAFATWSPDGVVGAMFRILGSHLPPPPPGAARPSDWGEPSIVRERLGDRVKDIHFERGTMEATALTPQHNRQELEGILAPFRTVLALHHDDPPRLARIRADLDAALAAYHRDNAVRNEYLVTRATKR